MSTVTSTKIVKDETREKCYNLFLDRLERFKDESIRDIDEEDMENMAFQLEKGVFDKYSENDKYRDQVRKILSNITSTPNAVNVRRRLYNQEWDCHTIGGMNSDQLYPELEEARKIADKKETELKESFEKKKLEINSIYTCGKCKQNKVEHYQKQTRSADEPMTVFCHCLLCGKRWRC